MNSSDYPEKPYGLKFSSDIVFGVLLRKNPKLCKRILEIVLDIRIREISILQNQRRF